MDNLSIAYFSRIMEAKPHTDNSDRVIDTDERVHAHYWGKDSDGAFAVCLEFVGDQPVGWAQLDFNHLTESQFYSLAGWCVIHHIPCLILADEIYNLDPRYPFRLG